MDIGVYNSIDEALFEITKDIKPLYYIEPVNREEEKKKFLAGKIKNPRFHYRGLEYDPRETEGKLKALVIPKGRLREIFLRKRKGLLRLNKIIKNRQDSALVRRMTIGAHGKPSRRLVAFAERLLKEIPNVEQEKTVTSAIMKKTFEKALGRYRLTDWSVKLVDKRLTTVYSSVKEITLSEKRKFSESDRISGVIHEVEVHVLRAANGYEQPLKILATGLPGYLPTEEGLGLYFEELIGAMSGQKLRSNAAKVIAVDSVCRGLTFRQAFARLKSRGFGDNQAWELTLRAYRGGGYVKDHVYLSGYLKVKDFAQKDGDFETLYLGKIGINDLPLIRELLRKKVIKKAKYIPRFLKDESFSSKIKAG